MSAKEKRNQIIAMLYQNMSKHEADETLQLIDELCESQKPTIEPPKALDLLEVVPCCLTNIPCDCKEPIPQMTNRGMYCLRCENPIYEQTQ